MSGLPVPRRSNGNPSGRGWAGNCLLGSAVFTSISCARHRALSREYHPQTRSRVLWTQESSFPRVWSVTERSLLCREQRSDTVSWGDRCPGSVAGATLRGAQGASRVRDLR